jgi:hypothetical protein
MNKKIIGTSLAIMLGLTTIGATNAFWQQDNYQNSMTPERFSEMQNMFSSGTSFEEFMTKRNSMRDSMREEKQESRENFREKTTRNVENIDNGITMTITSDDSEIVEKIQSRDRRDPKNESVAKIVENISNGIKITITSGDDELVEKIQSRSGDRMQKRGGNRGNHSNRGQGQGRGNSGSKFMMQ